MYVIYVWIWLDTHAKSNIAKYLHSMIILKKNASVLIEKGKIYV